MNYIKTKEQFIKEQFNFNYSGKPNEIDFDAANSFGLQNVMPELKEIGCEVLYAQLNNCLIVYCTDINLKDQIVNILNGVRVDFNQAVYVPKSNPTGFCDDGGKICFFDSMEDLKIQKELDKANYTVWAFKYGKTTDGVTIGSSKPSGVQTVIKI